MSDAPVPVGPRCDVHTFVAASECREPQCRERYRASLAVPAVDARERLAALLRHTEDRSLVPHDDRYYKRWAARILPALSGVSGSDLPSKASIAAVLHEMENTTNGCEPGCEEFHDDDAVVMLNVIRHAMKREEHPDGR